MFKIEHESVIDDFNALKKYAYQAYNKKKYEDVYCFVSCAATLAYHLNFCYCDDELESLINKVSKETLNTPHFSPIKDRFVFYDYFGMDNRGLTQQYIHALKNWDVEFLYILESRSLSEKSTIFNELKSIKKAQIYIVPDGMTNVEKTKKIVEKIIQYKPEKAFLHLAPWDVVAVSVWSALDNVERYFIDLTDHAFWLGKSCSDYFLGFRDYGFSIAEKYRNINSEKLLKQLYYPILNDSEFDGFPVSVENKIVIFSGASFYKIYGENGIFLNILKKIVEDNPDVVVMFAGSGNDKPFLSFIENNKLSGRILLIGDCRDINEVFKRCDIYLNTYPIIGGLMSQYAVANGKPIIGYTTSDIPCNFSEGLFNQPLSSQFTFTDLDAFHDEINLLIRDKKYRVFRSEYSSDILPTAESFPGDLFKCLQEKKPYIYSNIDIDIERFMNIYFSMENNYLHQYHVIKIKELKSLYLKSDFFGALISFMNVLFYRKDKIILKILGFLNVNK